MAETTITITTVLKLKTKKWQQPSFKHTKKFIRTYKYEYKHRFTNIIPYYIEKFTKLTII